ncbi:MAG: hypothetical protein K6G80_08375 [Treponema sp.]|nr:hypothetical protein [Treponema sp.]
MRKSFLFPLLAFFAACSVFLAGCSNINSRETASVSFLFDGETLASLAASASAARSRSALAREANSSDEEGESRMFVEVALLGGYTAVRSVSLDFEALHNGTTLSFDDVPIGKTVYARAVVYGKYTYGGEMSLWLEWYGQSGSTTISSGENELSLELSSVYSGSYETETDTFCTVDGYDGYFELVAYTDGRYELTHSLNENRMPVSVGTWTGIGTDADHIEAVLISENVYRTPGEAAFHLVTAPVVQQTSVTGNNFSITSASGITFRFGIEAYYPSSYEEKNVVAWYQTSENKASKKKVLAVFLFDDDTFIATRHVIKSSGEEELEIEVSGTYELESDDYVNNTGTAVVVGDSGELPYTLTIENGKLSIGDLETTYQYCSGPHPSGTLKPTSGSISSDNGALVISADMSAFDYLDSGTITLSVKDSAGNAVTDDVFYTASLMYKGQELKSGDESYYEFDGETGTLSLRKEKPLPEGLNLQLYVTVSRGEYTGSATFIVSTEEKKCKYNLYVSASGKASNTGMTSSKPLASISDAISEMTDGHEYIINVSGTLTGAQELGSGLTTASASAVTIQGTSENAMDGLSGGFSSDDEGRTLTIQTEVPVTIRNLTISGGYNVSTTTSIAEPSLGGGLLVGGSADVTLSDTVYIAGNRAANGGGVYVMSGGKLTMTGATISSNTAETSGGGVYVSGSSDAENPSCFIMTGGSVRGNTSAYSGEAESGTGGGGVCVSGENAEFRLEDGTISGNTSTGYGGGVCVSSSATFTMTGGAIGGYDDSNRSTDEAAGTGGGVHIAGGAFTMEGGTICNNIASVTSTYGGGAVCIADGSFEMTGGEIIDNTTYSFGGGVYIGSSGTFTMTGGSVIGNYAYNDDSIGNGVYQNGEFNMGGSAAVGYGNEVYLNGFITICSLFDGDIEVAARITPASYEADTKVLDLTKDPAGNTVFVVTPEPTEAGGISWWINDEGTLQKYHSVTYQEASWNQSSASVEYTGKTAENCLGVSSTLLTWSAGWYALTDDTTVSDRITVSGDVSLILSDEATLTAEKGISVSTGSSLTIYAQSEGTGTLIATGGSEDTGIGGVHGGQEDAKIGGAVTIHGGIITATAGSPWAAGIGGAYIRTSGTITIYGGEVTATGAGDGAGIGGGGGSDSAGDGSTVIIYGGLVTAIGDGNGAGIGGGGSTNNQTGGAGGAVAIYGGTVIATGSAGIGAGSGNSDNGTLTLGDGMTITAGAGEESAMGMTADDYIASPTAYVKITKE